MTKNLFARVAAAAMIIAASLLGTVASAQNRAISGTVVDESGAPIVGAAIIVVGNASIGAVTDANGAFRLNVPAGANINVSCIGYADQTVPIGNQTTFNFVLVEDTEFIDETVVIGYGVQRKSDLTGSVASVGEADFANRSTSDAAAALMGKAAGIQILTSSGAPGGDSQIRVRGYSSNSGSIGPLLIVDGLKVDNIQYLDPEMIESMEILKDAASAAIYGAQAGNGVVLITTKTGKNAKDGRVFYNAQFSLSSLARPLDTMNADQYIKFGETYGWLNDTKLKSINYKDGFSVDWSKELFEPTWNSRHTVGVQGGNDRGNFFVSLNNVKNNGIFVGDKDMYKRLSVQVNADYKIKPWLSVSTNNSIEKWSTQSISQHSDNGSVLLAAVTSSPLEAPRAAYADLPDDMKQAVDQGKRVLTDPETGLYWTVGRMGETQGGSPFVRRDASDTSNEGLNIRGVLAANFMPFKGFTFTSRFGYRINQSNYHSFTAPYYCSTFVKADLYSLTSNNSTGYYYQWENFANYAVTLKKHSIGAMVGMSYTEHHRDNNNITASGADILNGTAPNFRYIDFLKSDGVTKDISNAPSLNTEISYFGRLTYSYDNRYSLQANFRKDAFDSSKLSVKNRWGFFPSVSAGWTVSNESFIKENVSRDILNFLKFRGSWGVNGNIAVLSGYPYSTSIALNSVNYQFGEDNTLTPGSQPDGLANPDLTWETSVQTDFGMDARFLDDRLSLGVDWYNKDTRGLLVNISPVPEVGIGSTIVNAGSVNNTGWEFELGWQDTIGDFHYSINGNFSTLKNMVTYLEPSVGRQPGTSFGNLKFRTYFEEGYPVWYFRGYRYAGMDEDGKALFYTAPDEQGEVSTTKAPTDDDMGYMGSALPTMNYGLTIRMDWKGLDFSVFGTGAAGHQLMPCVTRVDHMQINGLTYFYENCGKTLPKLENIWNNKEFWSSSAAVFRGDYFKVKQIQLGYTLPKKVLNKVMISNLRVYASMDDWFVITKYPGFDPETASTGSTSGMGLDKGSYPNAKKLMFGVNISF